MNTPERFILPTDEQLIKLAIIFNNGKFSYKKIANMVALCRLVVDRLFENGDITIPSSNEIELQ
jgi:predicted restriction endonuclease